MQVATAPDLQRIDKVEERTGLKRATIYKYVAEGRFPAPVQIGSRMTAWLSTEIDSWVVAQIALARANPSLAAERSSRAAHLRSQAALAAQ